MLKLHLEHKSVYDEENDLFVDIQERDVCLEHSLYSMAKWESEFEKPFLKKNYKMSISESVRYLQFMVIGDPISVEEATYLYATFGTEIHDYIGRAMTATTFSAEHTKPDRSIVTAELIYYWMFSNQIPLECEHWHLNRLLTLIRVFGVKNAPKKKMSRNDVYRQQSALNAERRAALRTKG